MAITEQHSILCKQISGHLNALQYHPQDTPYFYPDPADNLLGFTLEA